MPRQTTAPNPLRSISPLTWAVVGLIAVILAFAWHVPLEWMYDRWTAPESYYSHGFFVPPVALFLIWRDRFNLQRAAAVPSAWGSTIGLGVMLAGILLFLISGLISVFFTAAFSLILVLWGMTGFLFGWPVMKRLIFPAFVLCFMVPMPLQTIANLSYQLKIMVTKLTLMLLSLMGYTAVNDGSTIYLSDSVLTVGNACSGLRSLISLIFLGLLFAFISNLTLPRRIIVFLSSIPIAIISNMARVMLLCLVAYYYGQDAVSGPVHDISGYLIFVVAFILLYGVVSLLGIGMNDKSEKEPAEATPDESAQSSNAEQPAAAAGKGQSTNA